jgi:hypothetical protein
MTTTATAERANYRALLSALRRHEVSEFRRWAGANFPDLRVGAWRVVRSTIAMIFVVVISLLLCLLILMIALVPLGLIVYARDRSFAGVAGQTALELAVVLVAGALALWACRLMADALRRDARLRTNWRRMYRLTRFARDNGLAYEAEAKNPHRTGTIFDAGVKRSAFDIISAGPASNFEIGNYQYGGHWNRERVLRRFGYFRIKLPRGLPHIVLEARRNRRSFGRSNLPWQFRPTQVLSLEGDFDRHFTLHVPAGYEQDALYLFTPDLMVLFIDRAADYDVEIVDDWMYVYSPTFFRMLDPNTYERVFAVLETVGRKTLDRASRYSDHQIPTGAGTTGYRRRLRRSIPIGPIIVSGTFVTLVTLRLVFNY